MRMSALLKSFFGFLLSFALHTEIHLIEGEAARTLFICDDDAHFDCWFAEGKSYCSLDIGDAFNVKTSATMQLIVRGSIAKEIYAVTRHCYDDDEPQFRFDYGRRGIHCFKSVIDDICWLDIDKAYAQS